uniref:Uncharacterized protein n=1 Tax=Glossina palpalis gambiensis TaxID=67801 RepID=A0A1B0BCA5_9MUSC
MNPGYRDEIRFVNLLVANVTHVQNTFEHAYVWQILFANHCTALDFHRFWHVPQPICDGNIPAHPSTHLTNDVFAATDNVSPNIQYLWDCWKSSHTVFCPLVLLMLFQSIFTSSTSGVVELELRQLLLFCWLLSLLTLACSTNSNNNFGNVASSLQLSSLTANSFNRARFSSNMAVNLSMSKLFLPLKPNTI